jgi:GT2 family glycosyltransferase
VVTFNRREPLLACLRALAAQSRALDEVIVVDNASTDGTAEALRSFAETSALPLQVVSMPRNGGGAEGFHHGIRAAVAGDSDWLWLMDDDCAPEPACLATLLASPRAGAAQTTLLAPVVLSSDLRLLPLNRGRARGRWLMAPLAALPEAMQRGEEECEIGFSTFVGPLIRTEAARAAGLPVAEMFIRNDDVEYTLRLAGPGYMWLVPAARIVHDDPQPFENAASFRARLREFLRPAPLDHEWKHLYALRNLIFLARRHDLGSPAQTLSFAGVQVARRLVLSRPRRRAAYLAALYAADGFRGAFRNVVPDQWPPVARASDARRELSARALRYGDPVPAPPVRPRHGR